MRSEQLYVYNYKQLVEGIRLSPWMSGYEWWCFAEFWMSGDGIVDFNEFIRYVQPLTHPTTTQIPWRGHDRR